jgi:hypothetical protein
MPTVKAGCKRGEVTAGDPAAAVDVVDREGVDAVTIRRARRGVRAQPLGRRTATDRIEEKR